MWCAGIGWAGLLSDPMLSRRRFLVQSDFVSRMYMQKTMSVFVPSVVPSPDGGFRELGQPPAPQGADGVRLEVLGGCAVAVAVVEGNVTQGVAGEVGEIGGSGEQGVKMSGQWRWRGT